MLEHARLKRQGPEYLKIGGKVSIGLTPRLHGYHVCRKRFCILLGGRGDNPGRIQFLNDLIAVVLLYGSAFCHGFWLVSTACGDEKKESQERRRIY